MNKILCNSLRFSHCFVERTQINLTLLSLNALSAIETQKRFAGHSKWQNIKNIKAKTDALRSKLHSSYALKLRKAAAEGGGPDPKTNSKLAAVIEEAKSRNVTKEVIERALKASANVTLKPYFIEFQGPGGSLFMANVECDNISIFRSTMKKVLKKAKGCLMKEGTVKFRFQERGIVRIAKQDKEGNPVTFEKIEELAIEAGAEEVVDSLDESKDNENRTEDEDDYWILKTSPEDIYAVKGYIEKNATNIEILYCDIDYLPMLPLKLKDDELTAVSQLIETLEEMPEIVKLTNNIKH